MEYFTKDELLDEDIEGYKVRDAIGEELNKLKSIGKDNKERWNMTDVYAYFDQIEYDSPGSKKHLCELIPHYFRLVQDGENMSALLEKVYKNQRAKTVLPYLEEQLIKENFSARTKGVVAEGISRAIRVFPHGKTRSRFICNAVALLVREFRDFDAGEMVRYLSTPALQISQHVAAVNPVLADDQDLMPGSVAEDSIEALTFALVTQIALKIGVYTQNLDFTRGGSSPSRSPTTPSTGTGATATSISCFSLTPSDRSKITYPELKYWSSTGQDSPQLRQNLARLCKSVSCIASFTNKPYIVPARTNLNAECETTPLGLASYVYMAECHAKDINNLSTGVAKDAYGSSSSKSTTGTEHGEPTSSAGETPKTAEKQIVIPSLLPAVFSREMRYQYVASAVETLLLNQQYAAAFHLFQYSLVPQVGPIMESSMATPRENRRSNLWDCMIRPSLYVELLNALTFAVVKTDEGTGEEIKKAVEETGLCVGNGAAVGSCCPPKDDAKSPKSPKSPIVKAQPEKDALGRVIEDNKPQVGTHSTKTAIFRDVEKVLRCVTAMNKDDLKSEYPDCKDDTMDVLTTALSLYSRFTNYYCYTIKYKKDDAIIATVVGSFKTEWWEVVQLVERLRDSDASVEKSPAFERTVKVLNLLLDRMFRMVFSGDTSFVKARKNPAKRIKHEDTNKTWRAMALEQRKEKEGDSTSSKTDDKIHGQTVSVVDGSDSLAYGLNLARLVFSERCKKVINPDMKQLRKYLDDLSRKIDLETQMANKSPNTATMKVDIPDMLNASGHQVGGKVFKDQRITQVSFLLQSVREAAEGLLEPKNKI